MQKRSTSFGDCFPQRCPISVVLSSNFTPMEQLPVRVSPHLRVKDRTCPQMPLTPASSPYHHSPAPPTRHPGTQVFVSYHQPFKAHWVNSGRGLVQGGHHEKSNQARQEAGGSGAVFRLAAVYEASESVLTTRAKCTKHLTALLVNASQSPWKHTLSH